METKPDKDTSPHETHAEKEKKKKEKIKFEDTRKFLSTDQIVKNHNEIKDMASNILSPKSKIKNARTENFQQAMERQGINNADLLQIYKNYVLAFYISFIAGTFSILYGFHLFVSGDGLITTLSCTAMGIFCYSNGFKFSFRSFQIKYQKLCSVQDYWKRKEIFPRFDIKKR